MKPSTALSLHRDAVREVVTRFRSANPRVFGSALFVADEEGSDLDILVDALPGATLFDLGGQIAAEAGVSPATVSRILRRLGLNRLSALEPAEPVQRYERENPGELIHIDIKKLGR
jgi:Bacterial regulatory proteins, lacI family